MHSVSASEWMHRKFFTLMAFACPSVIIHPFRFPSNVQSVLFTYIVKVSRDSQTMFTDCLEILYMRREEEIQSATIYCMSTTSYYFWCNATSPHFQNASGTRPLKKLSKKEIPEKVNMGLRT